MLYKNYNNIFTENTMDPQLNSLYELTKTDMQDFMQECYEYCVSEYNRGQDEITK